MTSLKLTQRILAISACMLITSCGGGGSSIDSDSSKPSAPSIDSKTKALSVSSQPAMAVIALLKVSETRISRTVYDYQFKIVIENKGAAIDDVIANVLTVPTGSQVINGSLAIGSLEANSSSTSLATITLRQDRLFAFDPKAISWSISGVSPTIAVVSVSGGLIEVVDPDSKIKGTALKFPTAALDQSETVSIRYSDVPQLDIPQDRKASAASKLIRLDRGRSHENFHSMIQLTFPYSTTGGKLPIVWTRDSAGTSWRPIIPLSVDTNSGKVTIQTLHFSEYFAAVSDELESIRSIMSDANERPIDNADSGFRTETDGFFIRNPQGTINSNDGGLCTGLSSFSAYYFAYAKSTEGVALANNFRQTYQALNPTDTHSEDDVVATELAARAWNSADIARAGDIQNDYFSQLARFWTIQNHADKMASAIYFLKILKTPLELAMYTANLTSQDKGHSVTVYSYSGTNHQGKFHIYDSNFPASFKAANGLANDPTIDWSSAGGFSNYSYASWYASIGPFKKFYFDTDASILSSSGFTDLLTRAKQGFSTGSILGKLSSTDPSGKILASGVNTLLPHVSVSSIGIDGSPVDVTKIVDPKIVISSGDSYGVKFDATAMPDGTVVAYGAGSIPGLIVGDNPALVSLQSANGVWYAFGWITISKPNPGPALQLFDTFDGQSVDLSVWNVLDGLGGHSIAGSELTFGRASSANTKNKRLFSGSKIIVEARLAGKGGGRDTNIALIDAISGDYIYAGDTNYFGWGLYSHASGAYNLTPPNQSRGAPTGGINLATNGVTFSSFKIIRLTIEGNSLTVERGDSSNALTEKLQRTLGSSTAGRQFYLQIGTGGGIEYSPGTFDWVAVSTQL